MHLPMVKFIFVNLNFFVFAFCAASANITNVYYIPYSVISCRAALPVTRCVSTSVCQTAYIPVQCISSARRLMGLGQLAVHLSGEEAFTCSVLTFNSTVWPFVYRCAIKNCTLVLTATEMDFRAKLFNVIIRCYAPMVYENFFNLLRLCV